MRTRRFRTAEPGEIVLEARVDGFRITVLIRKTWRGRVPAPWSQARVQLFFISSFLLSSFFMSSCFILSCFILSWLI